MEKTRPPRITFRPIFEYLLDAFNLEKGLLVNTVYRFFYFVLISVTLSLLVTSI